MNNKEIKELAKQLGDNALLPKEEREAMTKKFIDDVNQEAAAIKKRQWTNLKGMTPQQRKEHFHKEWLKYISKPENKQRESEYQKKWRKQHPEYHKLYSQNMSPEQKQRQRDKQAAYREQNREKLNANFREFYKTLVQKKKQQEELERSVEINQANINEIEDTNQQYQNEEIQEGNV